MPLDYLPINFDTTKPLSSLARLAAACCRFICFTKTNGKSMKKVLITSWRVGFCGLLVWAVSCRPQELQNEQNALDGGKARVGTEVGAVEINYEMENTTVCRVIDYGKERPSVLDAIYNAPTSSRSSVQLKVMNDGSVESEILFQEPEQVKAANQHKTRPDLSPKITKAIVKNGQLSLYNATGQLVGTRPMPVQNLKTELAEMRAATGKVKANKSLIEKAMG